MKASEVKTLGPLAGYKGFGLGLCVALVSAPLMGAAVGRAHRDWFDADGVPTPKGHFFLAVDPGAFGDVAVFRDAVSAYLHDIGTSEKAPGFEEILIPGERGLRQRDESLEQGALIYESVWANTARLAREYGVSMPA